MSIKSRVKLKRSQEFHTNGPVYMVRMRYFMNNETPHEHDFHEMVLVRGGAGLHITENSEYRIVRGCVFIVCPGQAHTYRGLENLDIVNFLYMPSEMESDFQGLPGPMNLLDVSPDMPYAVLTEDAMMRVEEIILEIQQEQKKQRPGWEYFVRMAFMRVIGIICRAQQEAARSSGMGENGRIGRLIRHLGKNYARPMKLKELAKFCAVSESTLVHDFRKVTGESLIDYLIKMRLEKGAMLLRETQLSIAEISASVGFDDANYFSRMFRRKFDASPREYRKWVMKQELAAVPAMPDGDIKAGISN